MPLFQYGDINTGRYKAGAMPQGPHLYSWPMNNYWVTNFNADQRGGHTWTYSLTSSNDVSNAFASQFGWGNRIPFLSRVLPGGGTGDENWEGSFISGWPQNTILVSCTPEADGKSAMIQLRETEGKSVKIELLHGLNSNPLILKRVDVTGKEIPNSSNEILPFETRFYKFEL